MQPVGLQNLPLRGLCEESAVQQKRQDLHTHQQTKKTLKFGQMSQVMPSTNDCHIKDIYIYVYIYIWIAQLRRTSWSRRWVFKLVSGQYLEREPREGISKGLAKQGVIDASPIERERLSLHKACIPRNREKQDTADRASGQEKQGSESRLCGMEVESVKVLVTQLCLTLCDPVDCTLPGSSVHGLLQARIVE